MALNHEENIIKSWNQNAKAWVDAIQKNEIESRILVTNKVIVETVLAKTPQKVLDIGCGEGWLVRALGKHEIEVLGIDVVPELVIEAKNKGLGRFKVLSYQNLSSEGIREKFDVIVCNFSLLGEQSVSDVFRSISGLLNDDGFFIIQTLHPDTKSDEYEDGWKEGSWVGFNDKFTDPPPWYFRTLASWKALFLNHGMILTEIQEPINPKTQTFASIVFISQLVSDNK